MRNRLNKHFANGFNISDSNASLGVVCVAGVASVAVVSVGVGVGVSIVVVVVAVIIITAAAVESAGS